MNFISSTRKLVMYLRKRGFLRKHLKIFYFVFTLLFSLYRYVCVSKYIHTHTHIYTYACKWFSVFFFTLLFSLCVCVCVCVWTPAPQPSTPLMSSSPLLCFIWFHSGHTRRATVPHAKQAPATRFLCLLLPLSRTPFPWMFAWLVFTFFLSLFL